jgi:hypothetical protein
METATMSCERLTKVRSVAIQYEIEALREARGLKVNPRNVN